MSSPAKPETRLIERQEIFALNLALLITWIFAQGWSVTLGEGYVGDTDARDGDHDGPHRKGGLHYFRLAQDLNLFVGGKYITDSEHPAWKAIGEKWESLHPLCRWGGRFSDANHVSVTYQGKS